jgi:TFIIF-interacting CTD phosphatase-like protein
MNGGWRRFISLSSLSRRKSYQLQLQSCVDKSVLSARIAENYTLNECKSATVDRQLLILDIDETLLFATERPLAREPDFLVGPYLVYKRPHLDKFLAAVSEWFDLAVWTSSGEDYAAGAIEFVVPDPGALKFLWSRQRCTRRFDPELQEEFWIKDLKKVKRLGYPLERLLMVDDSPEKLQRQYGNHIHVAPFVGDGADSELERLVPFLKFISSVENVRSIEKRNWRCFDHQGHA